MTSASALPPTPPPSSHSRSRKGVTRDLLVRACATFGLVSSLAVASLGYAATPDVTASTVLPMLEVTGDAPPGEVLTMTAPQVLTWEAEDSSSPSGVTSVVQLGETGSGSTIQLAIDGTRMTAQAAVVWISRAPGTVSDSQLVRIALLGDAHLEQDGVIREGASLYVTAVVRGSIRVASPSRLAKSGVSTDTFKVADNLRAVAETPTERLGAAVISRPAGERLPKREITGENIRPDPLRFLFRNAQTIPTADGTMAVLLNGNATILSRTPEGDYLELRAERAVILTKLKSVTEADQVKDVGAPRDVVTGVYLEGDVRISMLPGRAGGPSEARLQAERAFYDFTNDRAILTDAVLHTTEPTKGLPIVMRAKTVEMIAQGDYMAKGVELSTSSFGIPTYSVRASRMYVKESTPTYEGDQATTTFRANNLTLRALGAPFFYLPVAGGSAQDFPLRSIGFESSDRFGFGARTEWGLYETLGRPHPKDLDVSYRVDYLDQRGPATGLNANYRGGLVTETTAEPWNFEGRVKSYLILDDGDDIFGGRRRTIERESYETRGNINFEHQHFLPEDWQVQIRAGYASDATFLEEYFQNDYYNQLPYELAFYAKRQRDSEQLSLLGTTTLNDFPTAAELAQEQAFVQRYPEIAYRRIGDSVLDDRFTFFSDNVASAMSFKRSDTTLERQGYNTDFGPGLPSFAQTGTDEDTTLRGDFRQEINYPLQTGRFKVVPYVIGRYTPYSESISGGSENRVYAATGTRMMTTFWRTDDSIESEFFDIHRVRHVVEPIVNLYTSGTTVDATELYIYDEQIDAINDTSAAQIRLEQRWQTKRGGPGRWRSVDFATLNVEGNFFSSQPQGEFFLRPENFRGAYFASLPETSIPRDSINADASWRASDSTIFLADQSYNIEKSHLATAAIGMAVQRGTRVSYYFEQRYVDSYGLDSNVSSVGIGYELSAKYSIYATQGYDFAREDNVRSSVMISRKFDKLTAIVSVYTDSVNDESGVRFMILPEGVNSRGLSSFFSAVQPEERNR